MATNPFEIFKQLQGLQSKMGEIQAKLKTVRATGSAGGGLVTVEVNGQMQVEKVTIAPEAVDPRDIPMLQDLVLAAVTDALERLKEKIREEVSQVTGMLGLPRASWGCADAGGCWTPHECPGEADREPGAASRPGEKKRLPHRLLPPARG